MARRKASIAGAEAPDPTIAFLEQERRAHEAFAESRRRVYVERPELFEALDRFLDDTTGARAALVTGASGAGKSALLANWAARARTLRPDIVVVEHYVDASPTSSSRLELIRRVVLEIRAHYGVADPVPADPDVLEEDFALWLAKAHGAPLLLVIDAIDQLRDPGPTLAWLPSFLPPTTHLVVSIKPGEREAQLLEREWPTIEVLPLTPTVRTDIARRILADLDLEIRPDLLRRVTASGSSANPLFLQTSLHEAKAASSDESRDRRIDYFLGAESLDGLMDRVVERVEEDLGSDLGSRALRLLWASRGGLTPTELRAVLALDEPTLKRLMQRVDRHLVMRAGCLVFAHDALRTSVGRRYFSESDAERQTHRELAEYFSGAATGSRRAREAPWQWLQSGELVRLAELMTDPEIVVELVNDPIGTDLIEYWARLRGTSDLVAQFERAMGEYRARASDDGRLAGAMSAVGRLFASVGHYTQAAALLERAEELQLRSGAGAAIVQTMRSRGQVELARGSVAEAEAILRRAVDHAAGSADLQLDWMSVQRELSVVLYEARRHAEALELIEQLLAADVATSPSAHALRAQLLSDRAGIMLALKGPRDAEPLFAEALEAAHATFGESHPETATAHNNLGALLAGLEEFDKALTELERARELWSRMLGDDHPMVGKVLTNIAFVYKQLGRVADAMKSSEEAIAIDRRNGLDQTADHATKLCNHALMLAEERHYEQASQLFIAAREIYRRTYGNDHLDTVQTEIELAHLSHLRGNSEDALRQYDVLVPKKRELLRADHPSLVKTLVVHDMIRDAVRQEQERRHAGDGAPDDEFIPS